MLASASVASFPPGGATAGSSPSAKPVGPGRILIVDDIEDNRVVLRRRLVARGFATAEAEDGRSALDLLARESFDLVLLDVMMPGMSGLEALGEVRRTRNADALPVIMVTAKSFSEDVVRALELGANDYVTKPVDFAIALARINTQIARKRAYDEVTSRAADQAEALRGVQQQVDVEKKAKLESQAAVTFLANHDPLTGLANRALFTVDVEQALRTLGVGEAISVLFVDLDRFKPINDTLGHGVGDDLLREVAARVAASLGPAERLARFGGDEFLVMLRHPEASAGPQDLARTLLATICEPFVIGGRELTVGASIGIATSTHRNTSLDALVGDADCAMYAAKKMGGGEARTYDERLAEETRRRKQIEVDLQLALKRGEFSLAYQPIIHLETGEIVSAEALLRWEHPVWGTVSPGEFIPVAEETGLIVGIGEWVLRQACRQCSAWPGDVRVSVNLSSIQIERGNVVALVVNVLGETGLRPDRLELEVTESVLLADSAENVATLQRLRGLGVRIALDDFGTGYSSLSFLRGFDFDRIKVDQSFTKSIETNEGSRKIIHSISNLASELGICTTAEGVENEEQMAYIRASGVKHVQGFLIGKPVPNDRLRFGKRAV